MKTAFADDIKSVASLSLVRKGLEYHLYHFLLYHLCLWEAELAVHLIAINVIVTRLRLRRTRYDPHPARGVYPELLRSAQGCSQRNVFPWLPGLVSYQGTALAMPKGSGTLKLGL
jgi:hypothetical protein